MQKAIQESDESIKQLYILLEAKKEIDPILNPTAVAEILELKKPGNSEKPCFMNNCSHTIDESWSTSELDEALANADPTTIELYIGLKEQNSLDPSVDPTALAELLGFKKSKSSNTTPMLDIRSISNRSSSNPIENPTEVGLSEEENAKALVKAVCEIKGLSAKGMFAQDIYNQAVKFAQEMATNYLSKTIYQASTSSLLGDAVISHAGSEQRFAAFNGRIKEEILATTTARTVEDATRIIVKGWFDSPDHKESMMNYHQRFGYALVRTDLLPGMAGYQWFAVGLFADD